MTLSPNNKKILIASGVLLVVGVLGYYFLSSGSTDVGSLLAPSDGQVLGQDILVLADKLKTVSIDSSFLSGALFSNLKDIGTPLKLESQGRLNPFALIGSEAGSQVTASPKKK